MPTLKVLLDPEEREALASLAERERRDTRAQAAILIRRELERRGLLTPSLPSGKHQAESSDVDTD
jgi:hypothetical protein